MEHELNVNLACWFLACFCICVIISSDHAQWSYVLRAGSGGFKRSNESMLWDIIFRS